MSTIALPVRKTGRIQPAALLRSLRAYWMLIKDPQTGLLLITAAAGYVSACCLNLSAASLLEMLAALFLTVGGSTVLNMVYDRDIDSRMTRTQKRPLPSGLLRPTQALTVGLLMTSLGCLWAFLLDAPFGAVVLAGVLLDVLVYTMWLKRRSPFSIVLGGLAGGMPVLAGRTLALGAPDGIGWLLALSVLLWIPTHMLSFSIKYREDYARAGIPTFPAKIGVCATRWIIAASTALAVLTMLHAGRLIGLAGPYYLAAALIGALLIGLVLVGLVRPGKRLNFIVYKSASAYMLASMLMIILGGL